MITFLRLVPAWVWVALALVAAGLFYGHLRFNAGQADSQAKWDAAIARGQAEILRFEVEARATEQRHSADMARIDRETRERIANAQTAADRTVADLRAGAVRVREPWRACPDLPNAGASAGQPDEGAGLQAASLGRIDRAVAECEAQVVGLQDVVQADRAK